MSISMAQSGVTNMVCKRCGMGKERECYELNQREGKIVSAHRARSRDWDPMDGTRTRRLSVTGELQLQPTKVAPLAPTCSRISG